jgi:hypothetical protein
MTQCLTIYAQGQLYVTFIAVAQLVEALCYNPKR